MYPIKYYTKKKCWKNKKKIVFIKEAKLLVRENFLEPNLIFIHDLKYVILNFIHDLKNQNVLRKMNWFSIFENILNILTEKVTSVEGLPEDLSRDDLVYFKYACIDSAELIVSFCRFKIFFRSERRRLYVEIV